MFYSYYEKEGETMELQELIMICIVTLAGIGGLVLVVLQEKGRIKPIVIQETNGFNFVSGEIIVVFATIIGAYILFKYYKILAFAYIFIFGGGYVFIKRKYNK